MKKGKTAELTFAINDIKYSGLKSTKFWLRMAEQKKSLRQAVEGLKQDFTPIYAINQSFTNGYNQAIDDVLGLLK